MTWLTLASTLLGAVIGVGSTLLGDRAKWRREGAARSLDRRRELYGKFLTVVNLAQQSLFAAAYGQHPADLSRDIAAREVFREHQIYAAREQMILTGRGPVVEIADRVFTYLRAFRDVVGSGASPASPEIAEATRLFTVELDKLRAAMRDELGEPRLQTGSPA